MYFYKTNLVFLLLIQLVLLLWFLNFEFFFRCFFTFALESFRHFVPLFFYNFNRSLAHKYPLLKTVYHSYNRMYLLILFFSIFFFPTVGFFVKFFNEVFLAIFNLINILPLHIFNMRLLVLFL